MSFLRQKFLNHPTAARVIPFGAFVVLTACERLGGETSRYWFYLAKTLVGAWFVWEMRSAVQEMRWAISFEAVVIGVAVFVTWAGLDPYYPKIGSSGGAWNPHTQFGDKSPLAWLFIAVRILGTTFIVPPLEEVFYRSFFYRNLVKADWQSVPLNQFRWFPLLATAGLFGLAHPREWLAGVLCGLAYQLLVIRKNRLGDAMTAHAITNLLLGLWVVGRGAWQFW